MEIKPNINKKNDKLWFPKMIDWCIDKKYHDGFNLSILDIMDMLYVSKDFVYKQIAPYVDFINTHSTMVSKHVYQKTAWVFFQQDQFWEWMEKNWVCTQATILSDVPAEVASLINAAKRKNEEIDMDEVLYMSGYLFCGEPDTLPDPQKRTNQYSKSVDFCKDWFRGNTWKVMIPSKENKSPELIYRKMYAMGAIKLNYIAPNKQTSRKTIFIVKNTDVKYSVLLYPTQSIDFIE